VSRRFVELVPIASEAWRVTMGGSLSLRVSKSRICRAASVRNSVSAEVRTTGAPDGFDKSKALLAQYDNIELLIEFR
jgi:hypothetical protein